MSVPFIDLNYVFDYIRMVAYTMIILTDLRNIANRKFSTLLYIGDIIMAFGLFVSAMNPSTTKFFQDMVVDRIVTPAAVIWASIHFYEFIKKDKT